MKSEAAHHHARPVSVEVRLVPRRLRGNFSCRVQLARSFDPRLVLSKRVSCWSMSALRLARRHREVAVASAEDGRCGHQSLQREMHPGCNIGDQQ